MIKQANGLMKLNLFIFVFISLSSFSATASDEPDGVICSLDSSDSTSEPHEYQALSSHSDPFKNQTTFIPIPGGSDTCDEADSLKLVGKKRARTEEIDKKRHKRRKISQSGCSKDYVETSQDYRRTAEHLIVKLKQECSERIAHIHSLNAEIEEKSEEALSKDANLCFLQKANERVVCELLLQRKENERLQLELKAKSKGCLRQKNDARKQKRRCFRLKKKYHRLKEHYHELKTVHGDLKDDHRYLKDDHRYLKKKYRTLQSDYDR